MLQIIRRYFRYICFALRVFLYEKPRGLDFHLRDKSLLIESKGKYHGYSITPAGHLKRIFSYLNVTEYDSFLDVGCGKGFVLTKAAALPYQRVAGIDLLSHLTQIAEKNLSILKLKNRIQVFTGDAAAFEYYGDYNHFFFFNPFDAEIMKPVLKKIIASHSNHDTKNAPNKLTLIYHNPACHNTILETGCFQLVHELYDPLKDYKTYIYLSSF
ncbi:MAG: class I SAM-dependent methyltransferase [Planctomycetaceae bacterium]|jgi:tRNA1(Val) A37 N6-methylase TrmN6|nr:class I SAM-dependent methyltransferase [Planctomycetaceae bacterium]